MRWIGGTVAAAALGLGACIPPPATAPLETLDLTPGGGPARTLIVLLHGRGGSPEDFAKADFPALAAEAGIEARMVAPAAHMGYYRDRSILTRLREDVIGPARERGVERVWLVGVSLGGTGALLYARRHPEEVDGLLALAPFLGGGGTLAAIEKAGGVTAWEAGEQAGEFPWELWVGLQSHAASPEGRPELFLGYGLDDRAARADPLLSEILPPERLFRTPGGHDWRTWRELWSRFLASAGHGLAGR